MEIKTQYPFIDEFGVEHADLIKHWAEDENGNLGQMLQVETGRVYSVAVDVYPCRYNYVIYYEELGEDYERIG